MCTFQYIHCIFSTLYKKLKKILPNQKFIQTGEAKIRYMHLDGTEDDEMAEMEMKTKCAAGQCKSIPDRNLMKIKVL